MMSQNAKLLPGMICLLVVSGSALAYSTWQANDREDARLVASTLLPVSALLAENRGIIRSLSERMQVTNEARILEAYLTLIRRDGIAKHAELKQQLDLLAENNATIMALVGVYASQRQDSEVQAENEKFKRYAIAWRDRWNSVMELFMAGGNFPPAGVPMPASLMTTVTDELGQH